MSEAFPCRNSTFTPASAAFFLCYLDERFADVHAGDLIIAQPGKFDGEVSRSRCDLQNAAAHGDFSGQLFR